MSIPSTVISCSQGLNSLTQLDTSLDPIKGVHAEQTFCKTHTKSSSWPHNRLSNDSASNLRMSVPEPSSRHHERTFSDSYTPRRFSKSYTPVIPRPHSSSPRPTSNIIKALPGNTPFVFDEPNAVWPAESRKSLTQHDYDKLGKELLPPTPNVAKERKKLLNGGYHPRVNRQVSFNETVVVISDGTGAEPQNSALSTLQLDTKSFSRPQSPPPPKHKPITAKSLPSPPLSKNLSIVKPTEMYDDSQLAMDLAEDIPSEVSFFSRLLTRVKRFN